MKEYNHKKIEEKWQKLWKAQDVYKTGEDPKKPKCYVLDEFPYPSGEGLHTGHTRIYTASDIYTRMKRMQGFNVLHPSGWDAFGLPAEQYAIKNKVHPSESVKKNTERYKEQMTRVGFSYDWDREINTTDPAFYKWTQWTFLKMLEKGLAFQAFEPINWCPTCQTGLANEDLDGGNCERCGTPVIKKPMRQWVLRITEYADRLIDDLDTLTEWPDSVKEAQRNWIGRSDGSEISFPIHFTKNPADNDRRGPNGEGAQLTVFTTRPDTLFGATYLVLAPEHPWITLATDDKHDVLVNKAEVKAYVEEVKNKTEIERTTEDREKTGVALKGVVAINPATEKEIPIYVADYVLAQYGTGAIMAVPAHDERDFEFAKKFDLPITMVICPNYPDPHCPILDSAYTGEGTLVGSAQFTGTKPAAAKNAITEFVGGKLTKQYRLKDWTFSRQRYWGEPIPVVHCDKDGVVPVPEKDLPVMLPNVESYAPTGTGESPLAEISEWVNTTCPKCGGPAKRETNTMPQWAGSSWYYLRFMDPKNTDALVGKEAEKYWTPVDVYVGGAEHVTRHLIYARFWHKFLYDIGVVSTIEPFRARRGVGLVLGEGGVKMSKRLGNVINPDAIVETYGADSLRVYEMFMGPFGGAVAWSTDNLMGARRFVERVWRMQEKVIKGIPTDKETETLLHQTIKKVGDDIEHFNFNTAIAQLMIFVNHAEKLSRIPEEVFAALLRLIAPFAPHVTEELWSTLGNDTPLCRAQWPAYDPAKIITESVIIAIQINGKLRDTFEVARGMDEDSVKKNALARPNIIKWLAENTPKKVIYVEGKIVNIVL